MYFSFTFSALDSEIKNWSINNDKEMILLAKNELELLTKNHNENEKKLKLFLLPKDEADTKNAIVEIRAGTGGLEASLFASDLFRMYEKISIKNKWKMEIISLSKSDAGGFKEVIVLIKGKNIYSTLKFESGVHRVQRVPATETQGRIHTSAATVAVLPEAEEIDIQITSKFHKFNNINIFFILFFLANLLHKFYLQKILLLTLKNENNL